MARLTKQDYDGMLFWYRSKSDNYASKEIDKLGRYEDVDPRPNYLRKMKKEYLKYKEIEQELGIDLALLIKAMKSDIYVKCFNRICHLAMGEVHWGISWKSFHFTDEWGDKSTSYFFDFIDYGKTWALTKEELE